MRASRPDISAPLSRAKKKDKRQNTATVVVVLASVFLVLFVTIGLVRHFGASSATTQARNHELIVADDARKDRNLRLSKTEETTKPNTGDAFVILMTDYGNIHIRLRPDLSPESVEYIQNMFSQPHEANEEPCQNCQFIRSEAHLLLQGILQGSRHAKLPAKGPCPAEFADRPQQDCPPHDPQCGCHGPTMTKGMVAWAGGKVGPDFFINLYDEGPVEWWGQQHTVWGSVESPADWEFIEDQLLTRPVKNHGGMNMLEEPIDFRIHYKGRSIVSS